MKTGVKFKLEANAELFAKAENLGNDFLFGNEYKGRKLNFKKHIKSMKEMPIEQLMNALSSRQVSIYRDDFYRLFEVYNNYILSLERTLLAMDISIKYHKDLAYKVKNREKLTEEEKSLLIEYKKSSKYFELDFYNSIFYARMLLGRVAIISKYFLKLKNNPSFTSFSDHKKFFIKSKGVLDSHHEYGEYIASQTGWFDFPIKVIRDRFLVHSSPLHMKYFGFPSGNLTDLCLVLMIPDNLERNLGHIKVINLSIIKLSIDLNEFLHWFNDYGVKVLKQKNKS